MKIQQEILILPEYRPEVLSLMTLFEKSRENILTGNQISPFETTVTISKGIH